MSNTAQEYAIYYTAAVGGIAAGTVWNRVVWDGVTTWSPPSGSSAVLDGANQYPIGSTYTASAS